MFVKKKKITGTSMEEKELSDAPTCLARSISLNEGPPDRYTSSGHTRGRICLMQRKRKQNQIGLSRNLSSTMSGNWKDLSRAKRWTFKLIQKAAQRMLELPMPVAMPYKEHIKISWETHRNIGKRKTKCACVADADGSTRPRPGRAGHKRYQDHFTVKRMNSITDYSFVLEFIPMPQALNFPYAKAALEK